MRRLLLVCALFSGCGDDGNTMRDAGPPDAPPDANPNLTEVALVPATINRNVDILFVIDDSPSMTDKQTNLKASFANMVSILSTVQGGLPNLHIGVVTTDMGVKGEDDATAGAPVGGGPGSCTGVGKDGALQIFTAPVTPDKYLSDEDSGGGRVRNYTGTLEDAFKAMASAGAAGCGFEQPLAALRRSFDNPANAGFIRATARLAIVMLTDEDDCSMAHSTLLTTDTSTLGFLNSFRCTQFGVTCDVNGVTTDDMAVTNTKDQCHSREDSAYLTDIAGYATYLSTLKADPREVIFAAIAGAQSPFVVELRGTTTMIPTLVESCAYAGANGNEIAVPPSRIASLATSLRRGSMDSVCDGNLGGVMASMGQRIKSLVGDPCVVQPIAMPAACEVYDVRGTVETFVPACDATHTTDCFRVVSDAALCPAGQQLKLEVERSTTPSADTWTSLRCAL